jgi:hypothetical protein
MQGQRQQMQQNVPAPRQRQQNALEQQKRPKFDVRLRVYQKLPP